MGLARTSDQRRATSFLRERMAPQLAPRRFQHQPHDRVLRGEQRKRNAFAKVCRYVADNSVRAGHARDPLDWPYTGCIVPGYPDLNPTASGYWEKFWPIFNAATERGSLGKIVVA